MTYFDGIPLQLKQSFTRIRRSSAGGVDSFGDATFTENQTAGFRGFFQFGRKDAEKIILAGREVQYDAVVYTTATALVRENDVLLFGSSTATTVSTRYHVRGVKNVYDGTTVDHRELYVAQELV